MAKLTKGFTSPRDLGLPAPAGGDVAMDNAGATTWNLIKTSQRSSDLVEFERLLVSFFVDAAELLGVPKSVAAIYGICFASPAPLSSADIGDRLDISKGSISQGLRVLREAGALRIKSNPLERCDRFEPDLELRKLVIRFVDNRLQKQLGAGKTRLTAIADAVPSSDDRAAKVLRDRINSLRTWHDKTRSLLPLIKGFLKLT